MRTVNKIENLQWHMGEKDDERKFQLPDGNWITSSYEGMAPGSIVYWPYDQQYYKIGSYLMNGYHHGCWAQSFEELREISEHERLNPPGLFISRSPKRFQALYPSPERYYLVMDFQGEVP